MEEEGLRVCRGRVSYRVLLEGHARPSLLKGDVGAVLEGRARHQLVREGRHPNHTQRQGHNKGQHRGTGERTHVYMRKKEAWHVARDALVSSSPLLYVL